MGRKKEKEKEKQAAQDTGFGREMPYRAPGRERLTPADVQQKVFRLAFRGYNEKDVDEFLDVATEDLAALHEDNKRLREELELRGGSWGGLDEARAHAEETVRGAREEAARILEEAERRAGLADAAGGGAVTPGFLMREREFLHRLASLVQEHAGFLKSEARRAKRSVPEAPDDDEGGVIELGEPELVEPELVEPEPLERSEAEPALDPTAPMEPVGRGGEDAASLLSEWSNPFAPADADGPEGEQADVFASQRVPGEGGLSGEGEEEEPSLRELFWGEE